MKPGFDLAAEQQRQRTLAGTCLSRVHPLMLIPLSIGAGADHLELPLAPVPGVHGPPIERSSTTTRVSVLPSNVPPMEPSGDRRRLGVMRARSIALVASVLVVLGAVPAMAQEAVTVSIEAGIDGYVASDSSGLLIVEISSPTLLVGSIETSVAGSSNQSPLEIAAGGRKLLEIPFPAPGANATAFVQVLDANGEQIVRQSLPLRAPTDALVVGVLESPGTVRSLGSVRSTPLGLPIEPVTVAFSHLDQRLSALPYLVAATGTVAQMTEDQLAAVTEWIEGGGRIVLDTEDAAAFPTDSTQLLGSAAVGVLGQGEVIVLDGVETADAPTLAAVLRDVPRPEASFLSFGRGQDASFQLVEAASSNTGAALPDLSWLLMGLIAYVLAVGPVNLFVLRRLDKTHLTWVTIPVLSAITVGLFWLGGPRQEDATAVLASSVIVYDGTSSVAQSGVVVVASKEGEYSMSFPSGWSAFPVDYAGQFGGGGGGSQDAITTITETGVDIAFDLPNLGAGSATATWTPEGEAFAVDVAIQERDELEFTVTNRTDQEFWYWGVVYGSDGAKGTGRLDANNPTGVARLALSANGENFESPILEAFWAQGGFVDGNDEQSIWPLTYAAGGLDFAQGSTDAYVFGFTKDYELTLDVDGKPTVASGPTLIVQPINLPTLDLDLGVASPKILAIEGADFVDGHGFQLYVGGAEAVYLSYRIPPDVEEVEIQDMWGGGLQKNFALYDWTAGEFTEINPASVDLGPFRGPTGEVVAEITSNEFNEIVPNAIQMRWDR